MTQALSLKSILKHQFGNGERTLTERVNAVEITGYQHFTESNFGTSDTVEDIAVSVMFAIFSNSTFRLTITRESTPASVQVVDVKGIYVITPDEVDLTVTVSNPGSEPIAFSCYYS